MKLHQALAVMGAGVLLFAASDAITYAATGSSLVLGKVNAANAATTIQNSGATPALRLLTKSTATAPMLVNGKGKVVNLYADRAAIADNASKVGGQTLAQVRTGINAATVGGKTLAQVVSSVPRPAGVVWVANSGGQFTSVSAALASITDNSPAHRYVIKVAPGTYTETGSVVLKNYVDVEGSGQNLTTITCACGSSTSAYLDGSSAVLQVTGPGAHVGIRNLTITNTGGLNNSTGIATRTTDPGDISLDALTVTTTGGVYHASIVNWSSSPTMTNVTATATGGANSDNYGVFNLSSSSPTMTNVTATATGGTNSYGIYNNYTSSPTMTNVTATATGGTTNYGVNNFTSSPTMTNVTATATGGTTNYGIYNDTSLSMMTNVTATGTVSDVSNANLVGIGIYTQGFPNSPWGAIVRDSFITGSRFSILNSGEPVLVVNTGISTYTFGQVRCVGDYNASTGATLNASCQ
jgi:hypothetical protein